MCGIFGVIADNIEPELGTLRSLLGLLSHRGPDASGDWNNDRAYLGHRRLSLLDLSENGKQPMFNDRAVICVNGEIYNFRQLRSELKKKYEFKSLSDSEVILHGYLEWGIDVLLEKLEGMFAFSIYDIERNKLFLARDRFGIKPLFYSDISDELCWSSELDPIAKRYQLTQQNYCRESLLDFATYRYIPSPKTVYKDVFKLEAAYYLEFDLKKNTYSTKRYWDIIPEPIGISESDALDKLDELLKASVQEQLVSDAPIGLFLSGGIDSALLAVYSAEGLSDIGSYSIGFDDSAYDESIQIAKTASELGISNSIHLLNADEAKDLFEDYAKWFHEPFADFSAIPTYALCRFSVSKSKACLSGDGADELFFGYPRMLPESLKLNAPFKSGKFQIGKLKRALGWSHIGRLLRLLESKYSLSGNELLIFSLGGILPNESNKLREFLEIPFDYDHFWHLRRHWNTNISSPMAQRIFEFKGPLSDALLTKVDRVSMINSLEVRVPFLNTRIVEFAFSLPEEIVTNGRQTKPLLRKLCRRYFSPSLCDAPKKGFGLPKSLRLSESGTHCWPQSKVLSEYFNINHNLI